MTTRRGNGEGSIYFHEGRNRYEGQYYYEDPVTGERKRKKLLGKSKEFLAQMAQKREEYLAAHSTLGTVGEWLAEWLEQYVRPGVRVKTYERY